MTISDTTWMTIEGNSYALVKGIKDYGNREELSITVTIRGKDKLKLTETYKYKVTSKRTLRDYEVIFDKLEQRAIARIKVLMMLGAIKPYRVLDGLLSDSFMKSKFSKPIHISDSDIDYFRAAP